MAQMIRPPDGKDVTRFLRMLFLRTEMALIQEILRKRSSGLVEYAEVAAMERVQAILRNMVDESWEYVPTMVEKIFYQTGAAASGYHNARVLTAPQTAIVQQLSDNLLGELTEAAETARESVQECFTIARLEKDPLREVALKQVLRKEAAGSPWIKGSEQMMRELQNKGVTAFIDKAGRRWSLQDYCNMAARTTARQAQVAALLTADDHDLWQIVKVGSTCKVCAALEGRVYSKSGTNPDYPPLTLAFGKVDPSGADDLNNTYLNIHPNCLHSLVKYTTIGKTEKQVQKDKDFSDPEKNPVNRDPRTKKQIAAYREKERNRRRLLTDMRQHREYRSLLGNEIPKDFAKFREMKYTDDKRWQELKQEHRIVNQYDVVNGSVSPKKIMELHKKNQAFRNNFQAGAGKKGNAASLEFLGKTYYSNSSIQSVESKGYAKYKGDLAELVLLKDKEKRTFKTLPVKSERPPYASWNRCIDSEAKLMEFLHDNNDGRDSVDAYLISDFPMCDSCKGVLEQFKQRDSNIHLNIIERKKHGNN